MDKIGITMLGASGTGKTCYLYAMADAMQFGSCDFTFTAMPYQTTLELQDAWDSILNGKWPQGTDLSTEYEFACSYCLRKIVTFSWYDYRGGILQNPDDEDERESLFGKMGCSRCLIICISAEAIHGILTGDLKSRRLFAVYMNLIQEYRNRSGCTVPIVFAVTKADLLESNANEFERGVELIRTKYMASLFAEDDNGGWFVSFVPVSLGTGLGSANGGNIVGTIEPANVHIPVLIAIKCAMGDLLAAKLADMGALGDKVNAARQAMDVNAARGWLDKLWNGDPSEALHEVLDELSVNSAVLSKEIEKLKADMDRLQKEINKCQMIVYSNGRCLT